MWLVWWLEYKFIYKVGHRSRPASTCKCSIAASQLLVTGHTYISNHPALVWPSPLSQLTRRIYSVPAQVFGHHRITQGSIPIPRIKESRAISRDGPASVARPIRQPSSHLGLLQELPVVMVAPAVPEYEWKSCRSALMDANCTIGSPRRSSTSRLMLEPSP